MSFEVFFVFGGFRAWAPILGPGPRLWIHRNQENSKTALFHLLANQPVTSKSAYLLVKHLLLWVFGIIGMATIPVL